MRRRSSVALAFLVALASSNVLFAAEAPQLVNRPDEWFKSDEGKRTVDNILTWQGHGPKGVQGWPKAYDASIPRPADGGGLEWDGIATIDNDATHSELRILARAITLESPGPRQEKLKESFNKGLDAAFSMQYDNGGWPQRWPPGQPNQAIYNGFITFNDNAMNRLMLVLKDVAAGQGSYAFVDADRRKKAQVAFDKGVDCILKCQIVVNGKLTGWCAQHDNVTLLPAKGRAYELPSISGQEGAEIAMLLMGIEHPDDRVKAAVEGAHAWFEASKNPPLVPATSPSTAPGIGPAGRGRGRRSGGGAAGTQAATQGAGGAMAGGRGGGGGADGGGGGGPGRDRNAINGDRWARFYDLENGKPIFSGRDSVKKYNLTEIELERQRGYQWYGNWGEKVLLEYPEWKKRNGM